MSTMPKTKSPSKEKNYSDLGETWLSCSGIHPEALTQVTPKSDKSTLKKIETPDTMSATPNTKSPSKEKK